MVAEIESTKKGNFSFIYHQQTNCVSDRYGICLKCRKRGLRQEDQSSKPTLST